MKLLIRQLEVPLDATADDIAAALARTLRCRPQDLGEIDIQRRSLDARARRPRPVLVLHVVADVPDGFNIDTRSLRNVERYSPPRHTELPPTFDTTTRPAQRPVVVGAGPAGLLATLRLAQAGLQPVLIDRGGPAEERKPLVDAFWRTGDFYPENNVLFGEGGAGLFSDGKLTARSKDRPRTRFFLETLVQCGAPESILVDAEPHLGSDVLLKLAPRLRERIQASGGQIQFNTRLTDIHVSDGHISGLSTTHGLIETRHVILATGHSARDVYRMLADRGVSMEAKPFAAGIRLELPQADIDRSQYGTFAGHDMLGPASFRLTRKDDRDVRACYSFCMCCGGLVIACASEPGKLTTNGMSYSSRNGHWGNAAFIVPVTAEDFPNVPGGHPALAGLAFQDAIESAAYKEGGGNFSVPAMRLNDFLAGHASTDLPDHRSCRLSKAGTFDAILPDYILSTLRDALPPMLGQLRPARMEEGIVYAAETRSSSPVRILRDEQHQSPSHPGLYPAGEGAGYAGGIVSSAIDGLKTSELLAASISRP